MTQTLVSACLDEYSQAFDRLVKLVQFVVQRLETDLKAHSILARVSGRVKTRSSLEVKLKRWLGQPDKIDKLKTPRDVFALVGDLAAVRVMTYVEEDRIRVCDLISESFRSPDIFDHFGLEVKENSKRIQNDPANFYRATHMQISLKAEDCVGIYDNLARDHCELQITSMLAHVWNEIEHDIGYKGQGVTLTKVERNALESLGLLTKAGDNIIATLIDAHKGRESALTLKQEKQAENLQDADELAQYLSAHFPKKICGKQIDFYAGASSLFLALKFLGMLHPSDVAELLPPSAMEQTVSKTMASLRDYETRTNTTRQRFDRNGADVALVTLFDLYGDELASEPYIGRGQKPRHLALALRYRSWKGWEQGRRKR